MQFRIVAQRYTRNGTWKGSRQVPAFYVEAESERMAKLIAEEALNFTSDEDGNLYVCPAEATALV